MRSLASTPPTVSPGTPAAVNLAYTPPTVPVKLVIQKEKHNTSHPDQPEQYVCSLLEKKSKITLCTSRLLDISFYKYDIGKWSKTTQ